MTKTVTQEDAWRVVAKRAKSDGISAINCLREYLLQLQAQLEARSGDDALVKDWQRLSEINSRVQNCAKAIDDAVKHCTDSTNRMTL